MQAEGFTSHDDHSLMDSSLFASPLLPRQKKKGKKFFTNFKLKSPLRRPPTAEDSNEPSPGLWGFLGCQTQCHGFFCLSFIHEFFFSLTPPCGTTEAEEDQEDASAQWMEQLSLLSQQLANSRMNNNQLQQQVERLQKQLEEEKSTTQSHAAAVEEEEGEEAASGPSSPSSSPSAGKRKTTESKEDHDSTADLRQELQKVKGE